MADVEEVASLYDPGEIGRADHNKGDRFVVRVSNIVAWLFPILMIAIVAQVLLRQAGHNQAWLDDLQWWLYGVAVLVGLSYAVTTNSHVRVDILFDNFTRYKHTRINIYALGWLFLPFILFCTDIMFHYMVASVKSLEGSSSPNGLHNLWVLKIVVCLCFVFTAIAVVSAAIRYMDQLDMTSAWAKVTGLLPGVIFALNCALYYAAWWVVWLTGPADMKTRDVARTAFFGEVEIMGYDMSIHVLLTLAVTGVLLVLLRLRARSEA
jgi:TRAP-type mannitol/chloroaromatic compound transport system permease small subunit